MNFQVYVINLKKDIGRLDHMKEQFQEQKIDFVRIEAVDGKTEDTTDAYDNLGSLQKNGYSLSPGEIGCSLSHKKCWEKLLKDYEKIGTPYALVCEDDIEINTRNFKKIIDTCIEENEVKKTWDYLQFNYQEPGLSWIHAWFVQVRNAFFNKKSFSLKVSFAVTSLIKLPFIFIIGFLEFLRNTFYRGAVNFHRDTYLTGAYLVHIDGAKKLLSMSEKIIYPADKIHNEAKKIVGLRVQCYCPSIVSQNRKKFITNIGS